jgi:hypothetical protein
MTTNVIEATIDNGSLAGRGGGERVFLLSYPAHHAKYIQTLAQEDAAIEAEAVSAQADEAIVLG